MRPAGGLARFRPAPTDCVRVGGKVASTPFSTRQALTGSHAAKYKPPCGRALMDEGAFTRAFEALLDGAYQAASANK